MSGIKDVARRAGVSISTVSNVLNHTKFVSPELTARVEKAAAELAYEANPIARSMKSKRSNTIGVITEDMCGVFYPYIIKGINSVIVDKGYQLMICDTQGTYGDKRAMQREQELFRRLINSRVDGIIFLSAVPEQLKAKYISHLLTQANRFKRTPLVSLERNFQEFGIDSVYFDGYRNAQKAVQHLIDCGCKKIAHITGPLGLHVSLERIHGVRDCLRANGMACGEDMFFKGNFSHQSGYVAMCRILEQMPEVDGVFCGNDQMAVGALKALKIRGRRVPEDMKIIGYDDVFLSSVVEPSLSTIHVHKRHAGIAAAEILIERIESLEENPTPRGVKMEGTLVVRESTGPGVVDDWILSEW